MLLRMMSSPTERSGEGSNGNGNAAPHHSLNSFVVSHQTPLSQAKFHRRPGLPKGPQTGSTGNLLAAGQAERVRLSLDAESSDLQARACFIARAKSASHELPQQDWIDRWYPNGVMAPNQAAVPGPQTLTRPCTAPAGSIVADKGLASPASSSLADISEQPVRKASYQQLSLEELEGAAARDTRPSRGLVDEAAASVDDLGTEETSRGVPVFVMMPLDTVNADGIFRHASSRWFHQALEALVSSGVHGIAIDVWWGAVERQPGRYDWSGYRQVFELAKSMGLKIQAVLSFHACGGNVGDSAQIPLPPWVLQAGEQDPDIFFTDRPRESREAQRNREYITFFADEAPRVLAGRSPIECYTDFMRAFRSAFFEDIGKAIEEIVIGCGPCGELRYASYPEMNGWRFPGVGEFQCYDRRALASLSQAATDAGHPEWGYAGPHDSGEYNSNPEETGFFCGWGGSWDTPYGRFFLEWYSRALVDHGERLLRAAGGIFNFRMSTLPRRRRGQALSNGNGSHASMQQDQDSQPLPGNGTSGLTSPDTESPSGRGRPLAAEDMHRPQPGRSEAEAQGRAGDTSPTASSSSFTAGQGLSGAGSRASLDDAVLADTGPRAGQKPAFLDRGDGGSANVMGWPRMRPTGYRFDGRSLSLANLPTEDSAQPALQPTRSEDGGHRVPDQPSGQPVGITLKVAGVHWWFRTRAHAAELTAGYFNAGGRDGYRDIIALCAKYHAAFTLTCVEMCDAQHPPEALCGPEGLLRQVKEAAAEAGVEMGGENALPCFSPQHIDAAGLDRIVYNTQAWAAPLQEEAAREEAMYNRHHDPPSTADASSVPPLPDAVKLGFLKDPRFVRSGKLLQSHLPQLRGLTFLRLTPEMLAPSYQGTWLRFMHRMQSIGSKAKPGPPLQADGTN